MTGPGDDKAPTIGDVAAEPAEESTAKEAESVGDGPDVGGTVPPDDAQ